MFGTHKQIMERILSIDVATKTLALCQLDVDELKRIRVASWEVVDCFQDCADAGLFHAPKKPSIGDCVTVVSLAMKRRAMNGYFDGVHRVVIEQQPCQRGPVGNPKAKVVSHVLQSFFINLRDAPIPINFRQPRHKFGVLDSPSAGKVSYSKRKKWSVDTAKSVLQDMHDADKADKTDDSESSAARKATHSACATWFVDELKKKDDAADAFLMGVADIVALQQPKRKTKSRKRKRET